MILFFVLLLSFLNWGNNIYFVSQPVSISFVGDVMLGSRVKSEIYKNSCKSVFNWTKYFFSDKDLIVANLETSVGTWWKRYNKKYTFQADPLHLGCINRWHPFVIANLANNHIGDYGRIWTKDTIKHLEQYNIPYFGAGRDKKEAYNIKILTIKNTKIWLIWQTCVQPSSFEARQRTGQNNYWNAQFNKKELLINISKAKNNDVDVIVFNWHCGKEYTEWPHSKQSDMYHFAIDQWVDLVVGHHSHRIQWIEIYKWKAIFYSLGNFISDIFRWKKTQQWLIATVTILNKRIQKIILTPVNIFGYGETKLSIPKEREYVLWSLYDMSINLQKKQEGISLYNIWDMQSIKSWYIERNYILSNISPKSSKDNIKE